MAPTPPSETRFATRLESEWSPDHQRRIDAAGIRLFRAWPAARTDWQTEWGEGNVFVGSPDDPAEVVLELPAKSAHHAAARVMAALDVGLDRFVVLPTPCGAAVPPAPLA